MHWAVILLLLFTAPGWAATCQHAPRSSGSWSWREVDGQRCWYEGRKVLPKGELHWERTVVPVENRIRTVESRPAASWLERVSDKAPPAEIYFPELAAGNMLETYPRVIWPQPWLSPDTIMNWPLLLDIDQRPFAAWTKRIGQ